MCQEYNVIRAALIQGGLEGPVNYYRVALANGNLSDHQSTSSNAGGLFALAR